MEILTQQMNEFIALVKSMRDKQKLYFKYRDGSSLRDAKKLERDVDNYIANIEKPKQEPPMPTLFD